jgi:hypothetical protein
MDEMRIQLGTVKATRTLTNLLWHGQGFLGLNCLDVGDQMFGEPDPDMKETFRQKFGNRVVWGDGQPGLHLIGR